MLKFSFTDSRTGLLGGDFSGSTYEINEIMQCDTSIVKDDSFLSLVLGSILIQPIYYQDCDMQPGRVGDLCLALLLAIEFAPLGLMMTGKAHWVQNTTFKTLSVHQSTHI